jgi:hypothetical protein
MNTSGTYYTSHKTFLAKLRKTGYCLTWKSCHIISVNTKQPTNFHVKVTQTPEEWIVHTNITGTNGMIILYELLLYTCHFWYTHKKVNDGNTDFCFCIKKQDSQGTDFCTVSDLESHSFCNRWQQLMVLCKANNHWNFWHLGIRILNPNFYWVTLSQHTVKSRLNEPLGKGFFATNVNKRRVCTSTHTNYTSSHKIYGTSGVARFLVPKAGKHSGHPYQKLWTLKESQLVTEFPVIYLNNLNTVKRRKPNF